jgi:hypothetical protein
MATEKLGIVIDATVKGKRDVEGLNRELGGLDDGAQKSGISLGGLAKGAAAVAGGLYVAAEAAKAAWVQIGQAAELESARERFDNLAASINTTGDALMGTLREATSGMVDDATLVATGAQIINLGLANTEEGVARLATAVGTLGISMDVLTLTLANDSVMRLDSLGLSVEGVTKKAAELEAQGFVGDAFDEAVLISLEEKMLLLGDASETTAGKMARLEASAQNVKQEFQLLVLEGVEPYIDSLDAAIDARKELEQYETSDNSDQAVAGLAKWAIALGGISGQTEKVIEAQIILARANEEVNQTTAAALSSQMTEYYQDQYEAAEQLGVGVGNLSANFTTFVGSLEDSAAAMQENAATMGDYFAESLQAGKETESLAWQLYNAADAAGAGATELALLAAATGEFSDAEIEAALQSAIMTEQVNLLAQQVVSGKMSVEEATAAVANMQSKLDAASSATAGFVSNLKALEARANALDGRSINVDVVVNRTGDIPGGLGGGGDFTDTKGGKASGGPVFAGNAYLVGEQGPEVVVMGGNGTVIPNNSLGGTVINIDARGAAMGAGPHIAQHVKIALNQQGRRADMRIRTR